jgi:hypothetical protein
MPKPAYTPSDIHPSLTYDDAPAAIDWLCRAFGFTKRFVVSGPNDRVEHSELSLGTGVVMVSSPKPEDRRVSPRALAGSAQALSVFVPAPMLITSEPSPRALGSSAHCRTKSTARAATWRSIRRGTCGTSATTAPGSTGTRRALPL